MNYINLKFLFITLLFCYLLQGCISNKERESEKLVFFNNTNHDLKFRVNDIKLPIPKHKLIPVQLDKEKKVKVEIGKIGAEEKEMYKVIDSFMTRLNVPIKIKVSETIEVSITTTQISDNLWISIIDMDTASGIIDPGCSNGTDFPIFNYTDKSVSIKLDYVNHAGAPATATGYTARPTEEYIFKFDPPYSKVTKATITIDGNQSDYEFSNTSPASKVIQLSDGPVYVVDLSKAIGSDPQINRTCGLKFYK